MCAVAMIATAGQHTSDKLGRLPERWLELGYQTNNITGKYPHDMGHRRRGYNIPFLHNETAAATAAKEWRTSSLAPLIAPLLMVRVIGLLCGCHLIVAPVHGTARNNRQAQKIYGQYQR